MAPVSKHPKKTLHRRGRKSLKPKHSIYKKGKLAMKKLKTTTKLLRNQIVLPDKLQPSSYAQENTIRDVQTIPSPSANKKRKMSIKKLLAINTKKYQKSSPKNTDTEGTPVARQTRSMKSMSDQKAKASPKESKTSTNNDEVTVNVTGKYLEKVVALETIGSGDTEATTNPNTPTRGGDDETQATEATTNPNTPLRGHEAETNDRSHEQEQIENRGQDLEIDTPQNEENEEESESGSEENNETDKHTILSPILSYIFADTDDENEEEAKEESKEPSQLDNSAALRTDQETQIYNLLEQELNNLEDRLRRQKEERLAAAEKQLEAAPSDGEKDESETATSEEEKDDIDMDSILQEEDNAKLLLEESQEQESRLTNAYQKIQSLLSFTRSKEYPIDERKVQRTGFMLVLLPVVFFFYYSIHLRGSGMIPSYDHEKSLEKAQHFFETTTREGTDAAVSTLPMEGIHVVLSENDSNLGSTIQDRFVRLGATVASIDDEGIDCSDLDSVAESVDALVKKLDRKVDFLIHTGDLCLKGGVSKQAFESFASESVQGYDNLFSGNYLSSFLVTQKILSHLEESRFGTLVQFSSPISKLVDGSKLEIIDGSSDSRRPEASVMLQQKQSYFSTMLRLPVGFAYAKLSEILQHKVLSRTYPNIRTMEITTGWTNELLRGEESADDFFDKVFRKPEEGKEFLLSSTSAINDKIAENKGLQDDLYEWSQTAVWSWVAPPTHAPIAARILGTHLIASNPEEESNSAVAASSSYISSNILAMVTSSTLALLAVKAKNMVSDSGGGPSWFSSE